MRILSYYRFIYIVISKSETGIYKLVVQNHCITYKTRLSLRGRRLKEKGMGVLGAREKKNQNVFSNFSHPYNASVSLSGLN